ncbi:MAG: hypothetical protein IH948_05840 [Bacteroidetes bacterium]|nr:hypothetical protein [Bacteroidota bacterium]
MRNNLVVRELGSYDTFWESLISVLQKKYGLKPVQALEEITLLHSVFPDNIKLFAYFKNDSMLAGVIIYEYRKVAHVQFIAVDDEGKELCTLDLIFDSLLSDVYINKSFFDFGNSNLNDGLFLNVGLINQKDGFGAWAITHNHHEICLDNWQSGTLLKAMR